MNPCLALIKIDLKLAYRQPVVIFFTCLFQLLFFFGFAELPVSRGGTISHVVSMVLVLGILGNGLFGAGMRTVQERDNNILWRFRVAPTTLTPLLIASTFTGWLMYLPAVLLILLLAHFIYDMPAPDSTMSLLVLVSLGVMSFRAIGLMVASVVNSMQESNIIINLLYLPMLLLNGATFPITLLPEAAQYIAQFVPASYLVTDFQGIFLRGESLVDIWPSVVALTTTFVVGLFLSRQLFRWEKEQKVRPAAKLWVLAVFSSAARAFDRPSVFGEKVDQHIPVVSLYLDHAAFDGAAFLFESGGEILELTERNAGDYGYALPLAPLRLLCDSDDTVSLRGGAAAAA